MVILRNLNPSTLANLLLESSRERQSGPQTFSAKQGEKKDTGQLVYLAERTSRSDYTVDTQKKSRSGYR